MISVKGNHSRVFWILHAGGWSALMLFDAAVNHRHVEPPFLLFLFTAYVAGFVISTPLRYVYRSTIVRKPAVVVTTGVVLVASFVAANAWTFAVMALYDLFGMNRPGMVDGLQVFTRLDTYVSEIWDKIWPMFIWSMLYFAIRFSLESRRERTRAERADFQAQKAQLAMLHYQMKPHFLFNALNSIRAMINEDTDGARAMVSDLADFLRYSLLSDDHIEVPVHREIEAVRRYLAIEQRRFGDKLDVTIDVAAEAEDVLVPCLVVPTLIENAVKHGMRTSPMPLRIRVDCRCDDDTIRVSVSNTGRLDGDGSGEAIGTGTGLENVRRRLETLYENACRFSLRDDAGWVVAELVIHRAAKGAR